MKVKFIVLMVAINFNSIAEEPQYKVMPTYRDPFDTKSAILNAKKRGLGKELQIEVSSKVKFSGAFKVGNHVKGVFNGKMLKVGDVLEISAFGDKIELALIELKLKPAYATFKYKELIIILKK